MKNFAITGVAGFVAPRHLKAIKETNNNLVAALDPHDSVGILDKYFPEAYFFTRPDNFNNFLEISQRNATSSSELLNFISICTPNYLHYNQIRLALQLGVNAICEKPLSIELKNLHQLQELEAQTGHRVYNILQLRKLPILLDLKSNLFKEHNNGKAKVCLTYISPRGRWYQASWKASKKKSGGLAMNIGIHFFDLLLWLFGSVDNCVLNLSQPERMAGVLELETATVQWFMSISEADLPKFIGNNKSSYRAITIDEQNIDFSDGIENLHTSVYQDILEGNGLGIDDAQPSLQLVENLNKCEIAPINNQSHPFLTI